MKKILLILLCALLLSLAACGKQPTASFFEDSALQQSNLSGMPAPVLENAQREGNVLYCNLTEEAYAAYVREVAAYLLARTDIYYPCYLYLPGLEGDVFPYDVFTFLSDSYDYSAASHIFAFSATEQLARYDALVEPVCIEIRREEGALKKFTYNTVITLRPDPERGVRYDICAAQHTCQQEIAYPIPGSNTVATISRCIYCNEKVRENFLSDGQEYRIIPTSGLQYIYRSNRPLDKCVSGLEIEISVQAVEQGDIVILVNGQQIPKLREQDGIWVYGFVMPQENATIEISQTEA